MCRSSIIEYLVVLRFLLFRLEVCLDSRKRVAIEFLTRSRVNLRPFESVYLKLIVYEFEDCSKPLLPVDNIESESSLLFFLPRICIEHKRRYR